MCRRVTQREPDIEGEPQERTVSPGGSLRVNTREENNIATTWGLPQSRGNGLIYNARAESVHRKPTFQEAFRKSRCAVPVLGFMEFPRNGRPVRIQGQEDRILNLAGIRQARWGKNLSVIITQEANSLIKPHHHRMPALLDEEQLEAWLDERTPEREAAGAAPPEGVGEHPHDERLKPGNPQGEPAGNQAPGQGKPHRPACQRTGQSDDRTEYDQPQWRSPRRGRACFQTGRRGPGESAPAERRLSMTVPQTQGRPGLHYLPDFITPEEQAELVLAVDSAPWRSDLRRRVQHHGYVYDYRARTVRPEHYLGPLPDWGQKLAERLFAATGLFSGVPVQAIVNEYVGSQGIAWHYDSLAFGPEIATISLLEDWRMEFNPRYDRNLTHGARDSLLETGSCLVMTGDSRYRWYHSIPRIPREKDGTDRGRRISLTFRTLAEK